MADVGKDLVDPDKILKEVFSKRNIETATDLQPEQTEAIAKIKLLAMCFNSSILKEHLQEYMALQKSKQRKSMGEFVEALRSKRQENIDKKGPGGLALFG